MSGPKTRTYSIKEQRIIQLATFKRQSEQLEKQLYQLLEQLAASSPDVVARISEYLQKCQTDKSTTLREYQLPLKTALSQAKNEILRLEKQANKSFAAAMHDLVADNDYSVSQVDSLVESIAEVDAMDRADAEGVLSLLGSSRNAAESAVIDRLNGVAAGTEMYDKELRKMAQKVVQERQTEIAGEMTATALEEMGYEVTGEFSTLFVEGGMVHFQKPGWDDYYVRLRVNPEEHYLNMNVVRIGEPDSSHDRKARDKEMEEAWCTDYPELVSKLDDIGIENKHVRELPAGGIAVQAVQQEHIRAGRRKAARSPRALAAKALRGEKV
ncbi:MAG: hypothetical protein AB7I29_11900 [Geobacter sp.]